MDLPPIVGRCFGVLIVCFALALVGMTWSYRGSMTARRRVMMWIKALAFLWLGLWLLLHPE
jgi:hypothetical protein